MGSKISSSASNIYDKEPIKIDQALDFTSLDEYVFTLEDLAQFKINGIQIGINSQIDEEIKEEITSNKNTYDSSAPPLIHINQGTSGLLPDIDEIGINNYVHCFCLLEVEEFEKIDSGIIIEFGEYAYGNQNDFGMKTFYPSKKGGLRLYVVKTKIFEEYSRLARIKCKIFKKEILEDILYGISREHKWRLEFYDRKEQNCIDFVAILLDYLQILNYEIYKGNIDDIPDKILRVLMKD